LYAINLIGELNTIEPSTFQMISGDFSSHLIGLPNPLNAKIPRGRFRQSLGICWRHISFKLSV